MVQTVLLAASQGWVNLEMINLINKPKAGHELKLLIYMKERIFRDD